MVQILHGRATTTAEVRRAIQNSKESIKKLSKKYGINEKTVIKWKNRSFVNDMPMGPKNPRSTSLTVEEEAICVAFRKYTLLPLDDCLYALRDDIPTLSRSALHRCYQRHEISRLPKIDNKLPKKKFNKYPIGYFHVDIAEVRTEQGKIYLFVAIDRTSKFVYIELHNRQTASNAAVFLKNLITAVPYTIHTILTDNGVQFTARNDKKHPVFHKICLSNDIEHRLTKVKHPWTNGQVERMNRTIKEATVKRYHYESHDQLKKHLYDFIMAYNFAKRLKALNGLTPYEYICKTWKKSPERFYIEPTQFIVGLNTYEIT